MAKITIGFGVLLILTGIIAYAVSAAASVTALIPAFVGLPLVAAGWAMLNKPAWRNGAFWAAVAIAALMIVGSTRGLTALYDALTKGSPLGAPALLQVVIVAACIGYLIYALTLGRNERGRKVEA